MAAGKCFLDMLFETNLRRERQLEGIAKAKTEACHDWNVAVRAASAKEIAFEIGAICSRKDRLAIVWGTAANPWDPDWRAARRPPSHRVLAVRHRVAGPQAACRAGRKLSRC